MLERVLEVEVMDTAEEAREATGWELRVAADAGATPSPSTAELEALRELAAARYRA